MCVRATSTARTLTLTAGGNNTGIVVRTQSDQAGSIRMTIGTALGQYSQLTQVMPGNGFSSGFFEMLFPFASFTVGAGAGTLPTSVNSISLTVTGPAGQDWIIDGVAASGVPEPASMAMIAGGLLALGGLRRRK